MDHSPLRPFRVRERFRSGLRHIHQYDTERAKREVEAEAVAPDGGPTGDVRDRLVVDENARSQDDLEPRTKRAVAEAMDVSLLSKGGHYEGQSASPNRYAVDVIGESCTCPDWQQRSPEGGCKHLRRVDHEIKRAASPDQMAGSQRPRVDHHPLRRNRFSVTG